MPLTAILFVLAVASTAVAAEQCPSKPETFQLKFTTASKKYFHCFTYVADREEEFCTAELEATDDETADLTVHMYSTVDEKVGELKFGLTLMPDNVYNVTGRPAPFKANEYVTELWTDETKTKACLACWKCFSGGKFAGAHDSGIQANVICNDVEECDRQGKKMADTLKEKFLPAGADLKKIDRQKCVDKNLV